MKVSVIIPVYNCEKYVQEAIASVLWQSFQDWEMIVVNDASTDDTPEILRIYEQEVRGNCQFTVITNDKNEGVARSRNKALKQARGQYIAFLDADDS